MRPFVKSQPGTNMLVAASASNCRTDALVTFIETSSAPR
jgi:hypothetical protein